MNLSVHYIDLICRGNANVIYLMKLYTAWTNLIFYVLLFWIRRVQSVLVLSNIANTTHCNYDCLNQPIIFAIKLTLQKITHRNVIMMSFPLFVIL